jgi:uncharacterized membrane protein
METSNGNATARSVMRFVLAAFYAAAGIARTCAGASPYARRCALVTRPLRWWAGVALAAYALCVWPANFKHAIDGIDLPWIANSWWYHGPRLAFQPVIIWWSLYCAGVIDWPWASASGRTG